MLLEAILAEQPFYPKSQSMETSETLSRQTCEINDKKPEELIVNETQQMVRLDEKPLDKTQGEKQRIANEMYSYQNASQHQQHMALKEQEQQNIIKQMSLQQQHKEPLPQYSNVTVQQQSLQNSIQEHESQKNLQHQQIKSQKPQKQKLQDNERIKQSLQSQQAQQLVKPSPQINPRASPVIANQFAKEYSSPSNKPMNLSKLEEDKSQMVTLVSILLKTLFTNGLPVGQTLESCNF